MTDPILLAAVEQFADVTYALTGADLERDYAWRYHDEGVRFALIGTYHELRALAATLAAERATHGPPVTLAQRILGQYHLAYRDLQAVLIGVDDELAHQEPAPEEWPITLILSHMIDTARQFFARSLYAVECLRNQNVEPLEMPEELVIAVAGPSVMDTAVEHGYANIRSTFDLLHNRILGELSEIADSELHAPSVWWEEEHIPVVYRLHRFDAHMRQHTIQCEKTLEMLGHPANEAKRLLRLIYNALAEVEATIIGAPEVGWDLRQATAETIAARVDEI